MNILVASGSFKDVYTPKEACEMINDVIKTLKIDNLMVEKIPMVDGGEYSNDVLLNAFNCNKIEVHNIVNPYGKKIISYYLELDNNTAFIGSSEILGLSPSEDIYKNPLELTSYGLGQLISDAIIRGYKNIFIGLGGTGIVDCGIGMAQAFGVKYFDSSGKELMPKNELYFSAMDLLTIKGVSVDKLGDEYNNINIHALCDSNVTINQMDTPNRQKIGETYIGDTKNIINAIECGIENYARVVQDVFKQKSLNKYIPIYKQKCFGVAGGINLSLNFIFNTNMTLGIEYFINKLNLEERVKKTDLVITGEGKIDNSLEGKTPNGISKVAKKYNKPVLYLTGDVQDELKKFFKDDIAVNLPIKFQKNGISTIISCHQYNSKKENMNSLVSKERNYKVNTPIIFKRIIKKYLKSKNIIK
jgi:glycerate 2-kinase